LKTEAKPTCGNGWQVTLSQVTVTNSTSALRGGVLVGACVFVALLGSVWLDPAKLLFGFAWDWSAKCLWAPEGLSLDV